MIEFLLKDRRTGVDVNSRSNFKTALHYAVLRNDYELSKILLENGADQRKYNYDQMCDPVLHIACRQKPSDEKLIELLLEYVAEPEHRDKHFKTCFDYADENDVNGEKILNLFSKYNHVRPDDEEAESLMRFMQFFENYK